MPRCARASNTSSSSIRRTTRSIITSGLFRAATISRRPGRSPTAFANTIRSEELGYAVSHHRPGHRVTVAGSRVVYDKMNGGEMDAFVSAPRVRLAAQVRRRRRPRRRPADDGALRLRHDPVPLEIRALFALYDHIFSAHDTGPVDSRNAIGLNRRSRPGAGDRRSRSRVPPVLRNRQEVQLPQRYATLMLALAGSDATQATSETEGVGRDLGAIVASGRAPIPWGWYQEGYVSPTRALPGYETHHNAPQYFGYLRQNDVFWKNVHEVQAMLQSLHDGTLPSRVSSISRAVPATASAGSRAIRILTCKRTISATTTIPVPATPMPKSAKRSSRRSSTRSRAATIGTTPRSSSPGTIPAATTITFRRRSSALRGRSCPAATVRVCRFSSFRPLRAPAPSSTTPATRRRSSSSPSVSSACPLWPRCPTSSDQPFGGARDANPAIGDLLAGFDPARLSGTVPPLAAASAEIPDDVVNSFPRA